MLKYLLFQKFSIAIRVSNLHELGMSIFLILCTFVYSAQCTSVTINTTENVYLLDVSLLTNDCQLIK